MSEGLVFQASTVSADAPKLPDGPNIYDFRLDGISVKFVTGGDYGDGNRYEWAGTLCEGTEPIYDDGEPIEVTGLTSMSLNTLSKTTPKAVRYLKALMTPQEFASFEAGEPFDPKTLYGRFAQADVAIKASGWPSIANLLPARRRAS